MKPNLVDDLSAIIKGALGDVFTAAALFVIQRGEAVFEGNRGWIDPHTECLPVTPDSLFDLASVSKVFTATAFLGLVSEGLVRLDDPLVSVIPEFGASGPRGMDGGQDPFSKALLPVAPEFRNQTVDPGQVTFRHLLTHTSGLAPWRSLYLETGPTPPPPDQPDPVDRLTRWQRGLVAICQYPFVDIPGRQIHYSDLGFIMLGEAVQRLSGQALDVVLDARIFAPLGLKSMTFNPLQNERRRATIVPTEDDQTWRGRRCWGEVDDENTCGLGGISGQAGLFGTARDVGLFGQAWLNHDPRLGIARGLMNDATREQATHESEGRGLGWQLRHSSIVALSLRAFGHTGFTGTALWVDPERQLVIACLTNRVYMGREKAGIDAFRSALNGSIAQHLV